MTAAEHDTPRCTAHSSRTGNACRQRPIAGGTVSPKTGIEPRPHEGGPPAPDLIENASEWPPRFRSKVEFGAGCWLWQAGTNKLGYGRYGRGGRTAGVAFAHRAAWEFTYGPVPEGVELDHLCRTPGCVRPDHLEPVAHGENVRRGRASNTSGWCRSGRHPWVAGNLVLENGGSVRRCRPCRDERERARTARRQEARRG